jgi:[protein-PII] uridylyltransferase
MKEIAKPELLYLAGLFHDIAKGRGGDHSNLGSQEAVRFCERHQLSSYDTKVVAWLVEHHLLMSTTAQRKDLSDPQVVNDFAQLVGDRMHLRYLYLLTVADIRGTNPALWSSWKDALIAELYVLTLSALRRGLENPIDRAELIKATRAEAMTRLSDTGIDVDQVEALWDRLGEDYLLRHSPDEIAWHTQAILALEELDLPLVLLRPYTERGASEIFIYTRDYDYLFAVTTQVLGQLGLTIADARIITSADGYTLDTYLVMEADSNQPILDDERGDEVIASLRAALASHATLRPAARQHYRNRKVRHFNIPTEITFAEDTANERTVMRVVTRDRVGILSDIGRVMRSHGLRLQNAKIATFGERVEDYFYITDMENRALENESELEVLRQAFFAALDQS